MHKSIGCLRLALILAMFNSAAFGGVREYQSAERAFSMGKPLTLTQLYAFAKEGALTGGRGSWASVSYFKDASGRVRYGDIESVAADVSYSVDAVRGTVLNFWIARDLDFDTFNLTQSMNGESTWKLFRADAYKVQYGRLRATPWGFIAQAVSDFRLPRSTRIDYLWVKNYLEGLR